MAEYKPETESVTAYLEKMDIFLQANEFPEEKRVSIFLSLIGGQTYGLPRNLCSPAKAQSKTYKELTDLLIRHFDPELLIIAECFHFHKSNQAPGESVAEFVAELRRLSLTCKFAEAYQDEALRDRFV